MDTKPKNIPELKEGQVYKITLNGEDKLITFRLSYAAGCYGCVFRSKPVGFCSGAKCTPGRREDEKRGVFIEVLKQSLAITKENWDFVEEHLSPDIQPLNERQSELQIKMCEGQELDDQELLEYYRCMAMLYVNAINNFTKQRDESNNQKTGNP